MQIEGKCLAIYHITDQDPLACLQVEDSQHLICWLDTEGEVQAEDVCLASSAAARSWVAVHTARPLGGGGDDGGKVACCSQRPAAQCTG